MFFPCMMMRNALDDWKNKRKSKIADKRKERRFLPARKRYIVCMERIFPVIRNRGSMTLETACVLPLFLFVMITMLQFSRISTASSALLAAMQNTAKEMAAYAYIRELGVSAGDGAAADLISGGLSAAYARGKIQREAGTAGQGRISLLESSFMTNDVIDLVVRYRADDSYRLLPVPKVTAVLRARVRAWTGREGGKEALQEDQAEEEQEYVYVTATGKVYHRDESCTHIRLSVRSVSKENLGKMRNIAGGKYHACERCGGGEGENVYITNYGDRYHSSSACSGLKRSVVKVPVSDLEGWRPCSKCGAVK